MFGRKSRKAQTATATATSTAPMTYEVWISRTSGELPHDFIGRYESRWEAEQAAARITARTSIREYAR